MSVEVEHAVTSGQFHLDGGCWDVDNNVWLLGNRSECVVFDAPHQAEPVLELVAGRRLKAIICTHAHDDHITAVQQVKEATGAKVLLHPEDRMLWDAVYPDVAPDGELAQGQVIKIAGVDLHVLHTPGHSPGSCCFYAPALHNVFTGDTLFQGGPGATGRSHSSFEQIIHSIRTRLLALPPETIVRTGHGEMTMIGEEAPHLDEWIKRGH